MAVPGLSSNRTLYLSWSRKSAKPKCAWKKRRPSPDRVPLSLLSSDQIKRPFFPLKWYSNFFGNGAESMKKCPRCGGEARRSHKHGFLQKTILQTFGIGPFRCRDCGARFYRFSDNGKDSHHKDQTSNAAVLGQPKNGKEHFKELIAQIREKEGTLGLGKQDGHMADELRQLHERVQQEGLTRVSTSIQPPPLTPNNGASKRREKQATVRRHKQSGGQPACSRSSGLQEIRPAELFQKDKVSRP